MSIEFRLRDFMLPTMQDPLLVDEKVQAVAERSQATASMVRQLNALHVPSACTNPIKIVRELWLDRGLLFLVMVWGAWQLVSAVNWIVPIRIWWVLVPLALLFPLFLIYSFRVQPATFAEPLLDDARARLLTQITGVRRVVFGHTHVPERRVVGGVDLLNCGFWSPAFAEPECVSRIGTQTFVRIRPRKPGSSEREASLHEWPPGADAPRPFIPPPTAD